LNHLVVRGVEVILKKEEIVCLQKEAVQFGSGGEASEGNAKRVRQRAATGTMNECLDELHTPGCQ
jgi:hypothetical protein